MFKGFEKSGVAKLARKAKCCQTGTRLTPTTWVTVVREDGKNGQLGFCLPGATNGLATVLPTRELVEQLMGLKANQLRLPKEGRIGGWR